ncbi:hypothetical protein O6H91_03G056800 [Diphasiastrum complanatum]|uniref:Uncharacterized protein n=1 Tax=Diphasiastrum complanatum TaxID=34168 RepID=A0ACC2E6L6_DIPCM|nr:hypothetical protein O6H91_03G056800 [Diphasiastrum complanatum]
MDVVAAGGSFACMSVATSKNPSLRISVSGTLYAPNTRNGAHFLYLKQKKMISVSKCSAKVENVNEYADGRLVEAMEDKQLRASAAMQDRALALCTQLLQFENTTDPFHALSTPLYQTATFKQPSATEVGQYDYTRSGNPSRDALESLLAKLEGADQAFCFTSGMAALATATHLVKAGEEIVAGDDIYGGSDRLLSKITPKAGVVIKRVDMSNVEDVRAAINLLTRIVWLESPTNPRQQISDIREIAKIAHSYGALLLVDNSIMSPVLSKPLELGADIVMHSATKFIAGHSDLMAGVLAVKDPGLAQEIYFLQNAQGTGLSPFDCWLCLRGIKTLVLRVEKQQIFDQGIIKYVHENNF